MRQRSIFADSALTSEIRLFIMGTERPSVDFDAAVKRFWKAAVGGALVGLPVIVGSAIALR